MFIKAKDEQKEFGQPLKFDREDKEGASILKQPLDDHLGLPCCYIFEGCWIELNLIPEISSLEKDRTNQCWQAFIYFGTVTKTAIAVGAYPNRIQAAIKAEQLIKKWKTIEYKAAA